MNIQKAIFCLCISSFALGVTSCSNDDDNIKAADSDYVSSFNVDPISCLKDGITKEISFTAGGDWTISSNNALIEVNPKNGKAGNVTLTVKIAENNTFDERNMKLTVVDKSVSEPYIVRVTQGAANQSIVINKSTAGSWLKLNEEEELFTDTIIVTSNVDWSVTQQPEFVKYYKIIEGRPENGKLTNVKVALQADNSKFKAGGEQKDMVFTDRKNAQSKASLAVKYSYTPTIELGTETIRIEKDYENAFPTSSIDVDSNEPYVIVSKPDWLKDVAIHGDKMEIGITKKNRLLLTVDMDKLDTEDRNESLIIKGTVTNQEKEVHVLLVGAGNDYFYLDASSLKGTIDGGGSLFAFDNSQYDMEWNPVNENPVLSKDVTIYAKGDFTYDPYSDDNNTPFSIFFVETEGGWNCLGKEASWAGIEESTASRAAIKGKRFSVWVKDRMNDWEDENKGKVRECTMLVVPRKVEGENRNITINDIYNDWWSYMSYGTTFTQKAMDINYYFESESLSDGSTQTFASKGGKKRFYFESNAESINCPWRGDWSSCDWATIEFGLEDGWKKYFDITVLPNTTGVKRSEWFSVTVYMGDNEEDKVICNKITIDQEAK